MKPVINITNSVTACVEKIGQQVKRVRTVCSCCRKPRRMTSAILYSMKVEHADGSDNDSVHSTQVVPYTSELTDVQVGQLISVAATIHKKCRRFSINLLCSKEPHPDIAFHFNPRMEQRYVVRNCRIGGYWGQEETSSVMQFDFKRGATFTVDIFIAEREFMVSVNGKHWCSYTHRVPLSTLAAMEVRGQVEDVEVNFKQLTSYPEEVPHFELITLNSNLSQQLKMPYLGKLSYPFQVGFELEVCGRIKLLPQNFYVNLQDSPRLWPHPNVPLHLNPRFCTSNGVDVFVRNSWIDGEWGQEERAPVCPFLAGTDFKFKIRYDYEAFTIWTEDRLIAEFRFRNEVGTIEYVYIVGDIDIHYVSLIHKGTDVIDPIIHSIHSIQRDDTMQDDD